MSVENNENDSTQANTTQEGYPELDLTDIMQSLPTYKTVEKQTTVSLLRQAWINERCAPDLLIYEDEIVESVKSHIAAVEDEYNEFQSLSANNTINDIVWRMRHVECQRLQYMLHDYLRTRIKKIEQYTMYFYMNCFHLMSDAEQVFCKEYLDKWGDHADTLVLSKLSDKFNKLTNSRQENHADMASGPDIHTFAFMQVTDDIGVVQLADDDEVELQKGDIVLASYNTMKTFLAEDKVEMI